MCIIIFCALILFLVLFKEINTTIALGYDVQFHPYDAHVLEQVNQANGRLIVYNIIGGIKYKKYKKRPLIALAAENYNYHESLGK